jgi:hypothetical protein
MSFKEARIGDLLTFQRGFDITKAEQTDGEIPIVSSSGTSSHHNHWKVAGPGIVIGRKGTLGATHFLKSNSGRTTQLYGSKTSKAMIRNFSITFYRRFILKILIRGRQIRLSIGITFTRSQ